ncbi:MAG TPA: D-aminopeptidase [Caulobacteraceae bacterium]
MTTRLTTRLDRVLDGLPRAYPGPGGAVAVVREGEVLARHAWGWANAERRIPFTARSLFRICSITKQFTCALVLDAFPDPMVLDGDVRARLPRLEQEAPGALRLLHNQSGLRDYWALAMLHGAGAEDPFGEAEANHVIAGARTLQFAPGTRYSYANQNFRLLGDIVAARADRPFAELLRSRIFDPVGMADAFVAADTRALPDGTEGYEGSSADGFRAAENRILWTGDAGMGASLDDMIAWERHIDATRDDPAALYRRLTAPVRFADGAAAGYGFGLGRQSELGRQVSGHGGGLRGWRSHRLYCPAERVSVVVQFNHLSDAHAAAIDLFAAALDEDRPAKPTAAPAPEWLGAYVEPESGLSVRLEASPEGQVLVRYGYPPQTLDLKAGGAQGDDGASLQVREDGLWLDRPRENLSTRLQPCVGDVASRIAGRYHCAELDAELTIADAGGAYYGAFSGFLGQGRMEQLEPIGPDVWVLPCARALDFTPPGDWTLAFTPSGDGAAPSVRVGCWLARGLDFVRAR